MSPPTRKIANMPGDASRRTTGGAGMANKTFIVRFKPVELVPQLVIAERAEFQGEHLVFLDDSSQFVALFLAEIVESWSEFDRTFEA